jgi:hypothetical protein
MIFSFQLRYALLFPQKHSRLARLKRFAILLVSSPHRLAVSATGGASAVRPTEPQQHFCFQRLCIILYIQRICKENFEFGQFFADFYNFETFI